MDRFPRTSKGLLLILCLAALITSYQCRSQTNELARPEKTPLDELSRFFLQPPRVKELIARHVDMEGTEQYFLLRYDQGNFLVKSARNKDRLRMPNVTGAGRAAGRWRNQIWSCWEDGFLRLFDLDMGQNTNVLGHGAATVDLADGASRLALAILKLGVEGSFYATNVCSGNSFATSGALGKINGVVEFGSSAGSSVSYRINMGIVPPKSDKTNLFFITGEVSKDTWLPEWYELYSAPGGKEKPVRLCRVEVLKATLAKEPLAADLFLPEKNIVRGYHSIITTTNNRVVAYPAPASKWRTVSFLNLEISVRSLRLGMGFLLVVLTAIFVSIISKKKDKT